MQIRTAESESAREQGADTVKPGALRSPLYRRFWLGSLASVGGVQLIQLAQGWLIVDRLDGSPLILGALGAATAVPTILVNLFGGVLADRLDRRLLILATSIVSALLLAILATLDVTGAVQTWHVIAIAASMGLLFGIDGPARNAFFPSLIRREQMMSAVALNSMLWQGTRVISPMIGGFLIAGFGTGLTFFVAMCGFVAMSVVLVTLRVPVVPSEVPQRRVLQELAEGVSYIAHTRLFAVLIPLTYSHMLFGMMYVMMMPLIAQSFGVGSQGLGLLFSMVGTGALTGTFLALRVQTFRHLGRLMLVMLFVAELFIAGFAFAPWYPLALALLFCASLANSVFNISSMTALQMRVPDALRGRVMGIHTITFSMMPLGGLLGGALASATSVPIAVAIGAGVIAVVVVVIALTQPALRNLEGGAPPSRPGVRGGH